jgi:hypothetical protein
MVAAGPDDSLKIARFVSLSLGAFALILLSGWPASALAYGERELAAATAVIVGAAALAWLAALLLTLARRTPRAVVALAACPTLLLAIFLALPD